jgi:chromosome segregation ATPase
MSSTPNAPEAAGQEQYVYESAPTPRWVAIAFGILFVAVAGLLYAGFTSRKSLEGELAKANQRSDLLAQQLESANDEIAELKGQFEVTSQKLGVTQEELGRARQLAQAIRKEQKATDEQLLSKIGEVEKTSDEKLGKVSGEVAGTKSDLEATKKDLEATKSRLERTVGDLGVQSGLIARNHEELEALKRLGERNIFEFDIRKSKQFQRIGPVQLRLNKTDHKKYKFTLTVHADDKNIEKKDKTVNEPVQFYVRGARTPYEIVVFDLQKDRAVGYLTTPKDAVRQ